MSLKVMNFGEKVNEWWSSYIVEGIPSYRLNIKMKMLKKDLRVWNKELFGSVKVKMSEIMNEVRELERVDVWRSWRRGRKRKKGFG